MKKSGWDKCGLLVVGALVACAPGLSWGQASDNNLRRSVFRCQGGGDLIAEFTSRGSELVAIVDAGDGPHVLPLRPWTGGPAQITWSDGQRTLIWSAGVQLHWMDGANHRNCGRGGGHH